MNPLKRFSPIAIALGLGVSLQSMSFSANVAKTTTTVVPIKAPPTTISPAVAPEGLADGSGIWVNMWNYPKGDLEAYALRLYSKGIRNVFLQTSRSNTPAIAHPDEMGPIIDACHKYKIRVIAWSFAELQNPENDAQRLIEACNFRSATGQRMDALAANMEKNLNHAKVEAYSKRMREVLGPKYPMIAVVYSPLNLAPQVAQIPWKILDHYYDVIAPMNYWNSKYKKLDAYQYTRDTVKRVRELCGRPDVEVHVIGDGMGTHNDTISQFFKACHDSEVTTASLYPNFKVTDEQMESLGHYSDYFPVNSRFRLAAFHEMVRGGSIDPVAAVDPGASITRGDFYKALVKQTYPDKPAAQTVEGAYEFLQENKILAAAHIRPCDEGNLEAGLRTTIGSKEAVGLTAALIDFKTSGKKTIFAKAGKKGIHWFSQPAFAAEHSVSSANDKPVNFLDASSIVLQANPGLR